MGNNTPMKDFHVEHCGGKGNDGFIVVQNWVYYQDGACRENNSYGALKPPPEDPLVRAKKVHQFYVTKLEVATKVFHTTKRRLVASTKPSLLNPVPLSIPQEEVEKLKELRKTVKKFQCGEERARAQLESYQPPSVELEEGEYEEEDVTLKELGEIEI